jgi:uncharacterized membrane protein YeaQ/YmgE (transglycosylase-associated protein family)
MELIAFIIVGCVTGLISRIIVPPHLRMGIVRMLIVGMVGGIFGGLVAGTFDVQPEPISVGTPTLVGAFLGALLSVCIVTLLGRRQVHA